MLIAAICGSCKAVADVDPEWEDRCASCGSEDLDVFEGAKRKVLHTHMGDIELGGSDKSHRYLLVHDNAGKYPTVESGSHTLEGVTKQRKKWPSHHQDSLHIYDAETHQKVGELGEPKRKDCPRCGTASYYPNADYCPQCGYKGPQHDRLQREDYERRRQINSAQHTAATPKCPDCGHDLDVLATPATNPLIGRNTYQCPSCHWNGFEPKTSRLHTAGLVVIPDNVGARSFDPPSLVQQIGKMNILSISGGRIIPITNEGRTVGLSLPVSNGYAVNIFLANDDTYTVQRVFRGNVKGERTDVYAEDVGEAAYQAGMFQSNDFGGHTVGSLHEAAPSIRHASPQAWRRLRSTMTEGELRDIAADIATIVPCSAEGIASALIDVPWDGPGFRQGSLHEARESRACELGNHSDCTSSSCSCPHHNRGGRNKAYMSGACAEGDHAACKMSHGTGPNDCQCRRNSAHKTGSVQVEGGHEDHVRWLMRQYALDQDGAEAEAQRRYEQYPDEKRRWASRQFKLEEITAGVLETNPGMNREAALNLAQKTIERFPRVGI